MPATPALSAAAKIKLVLHLWSKMALNVRMRDRLVKVMQYGCQMLLGYYGKMLDESTSKALAALRRASSTSRKAFWLLKSLNHVNTMFTMVQSGSLNFDRPIEEKIDFIEQAFLTLYFWYESQIFFARAGLFFNENALDPYCNWTWFGGDLAGVLACIVRLKKHLDARAELSSRLLEASKRDGDQVYGDICVVLAGDATQLPNLNYSVSQVKGGWGGHVRTDGIAEALVHAVHGGGGGVEDTKLSPQVTEKITMLFDLRRLDEESFDKQLSLIINLLEVGVSLHYVNFYKFVLGEHISEAYVGAMGVASSVLILYEGLLGYRRELAKDV